MKRVLLTELEGIGKETAARLGIANLETVADLQVANLAEASQMTGMSEQQLATIASRGELRGWGVPGEVADALVRSGVIFRAGELAAFTVEEIQALLQSELETRPSPSIDLSIDAIMDWKERVPQLSLDEETTAVVTDEDRVEPIADESAAGGRAEDPQVDRAALQRALSQMRATLDRTEAILTRLEGSGGEVELPAAQQVLVAMQSEIGAAGLLTFPEAEPGEFIALSEDDAPAEADESVESEERIRTLTLQMKTIQLHLDQLQLNRLAGDEDASPGDASEENTFEPARGEVDGDHDQEA